MRHLTRSLPTLLALGACRGVGVDYTLEIEPSEPTTTDDLQLTIAFTDSSTPRTAVAVEWFRDGTAVPELADLDVVPADATLKGQVWTAKVHRVGADRLAASIDTTIVNTAPDASLEFSLSTSDASGDLVALAVAEDADGDALDWEWFWTVDGEDAGIDGATVPADRLARGQVWQVTAIADDGEALSTATATRTIDNARPTLGAIALSPLTAFGDTDLNATVEAVDADGDDVSVRWSWSIDGEPIDGADGPTLTAGSFQRGDLVTVTATANDGFEDGAPAAATTLIGNHTPVVTGVEISTSEHRADVVRAVASAEDLDGDRLELHYHWTVDGVEIADAGDRLSGLTFGQRVLVDVSADDGFTRSRPTRSEPHVIPNTAPTLASAKITPESPRQGDTLTCSPEGYDDVDGHKADFFFAWYAGDELIGSSDTLTDPTLTRGATVRCEVTPFDGYDSGGVVASGTVTFVNATPTLASLGFDAETLRNGDTIHAVTGPVVDPDGDPVTFEYVWFIDGLLSGTGPDFTASGLPIGAEVVVSAIPTDGIGAGPAVASAGLDVQNTAPVLTAVSLDATGTVGTTATLTASYTASDVDGQTLSPEYRWYVDDARLDVATATLDVATHATAGATVHVEIVVGDGLTTTAPFASASVVVAEPSCADSVAPGAECDVAFDTDHSFQHRRTAMTGDRLTLRPDTAGFDVSGTFTVPAGVTELSIYALGAGGGGRGDFNYGGGGGGAAFRTFAVTPGQTIEFTVGDAGVGSTGGSCTDGGDTVVIVDGVTLTGGGGRSGAAAGAGGVASGGTVNIDGGDGGHTAAGDGYDGDEVDGICSAGGGSGPLDAGLLHHWMGGAPGCWPAGEGGFGPPQYADGYTVSQPGGRGGAYGGGGGTGGNYSGRGGDGGGGYVLFSWSSASPTFPTHAGVAVTMDAQSDTSTWDSLTAVTPDEDTTHGDAYYAVSFDGRSTFQVHDGAGFRTIVRTILTNTSTVQWAQNRGGRLYQVNVGAPGSDDFRSCASNTIDGCLEEAFGIAANQMAGVDLAAISGTDWDEVFAPGTLDFAVALVGGSTTGSPTVGAIRVTR